MTTDVPENASDLISFIDRAVDCYADRYCLEDLTYDDLNAFIKAKAQEWRGCGLRAGDRVALQVEDRTMMILCTLAVLHYGAIPVLLHSYFSIEQATACVQATGARFYLQGIRGTLRNVYNSTWVDYGDEENLSHLVLIASTSGTTGMANLVQHSNQAILSNVRAILTYLNVESGNIILILRDPSYLSVLTGEVLVSLARGCHMCLSSFSMTPRSLITQIVETNATMVVSVASLFHFALQPIRLHAAELRGLAFLVFVGEGASLPLLAELHDLLPTTRIFHCYGLTEAGPRVTYWSQQEHPLESFCVGVPLPDVAVRCVDEQRRLVAPGAAGHIEVKSPSLMLGYVGQPRLEDDWLETQDWGWLDEWGHVYIQGRIDDVIVRGGVKVPAALIEDVLVRHPAVLGVVVHGITNSPYHMRIEGVVVLNEGASITDDELLQWCRQHLPRPMWPQTIRVVSELPRKHNGKLDRRPTLTSESGRE